MNPAEFKTLREGLGLSQQWVASAANARARTVQYWESEKSNGPPDDVIRMITGIDKLFSRAVVEAEQQMMQAIERNGRPESVVLVRYETDEALWRFRPDMKGLPATAHAAMMLRVWRTIEALGVTVRMVFLEVPAYLRWLGTRQDGEVMRAEWAASLNADNPAQQQGSRE